MHDFAHPTIGTARLALLASVLATAHGQDPTLAPEYAAVDAMAIRALDAADPLTRGEAALWLADSGRHDHYEGILSTARDSAPPARHRGILAVGRLAAPGAETFLGKVLLAADADACDAAIAAFALGQLDDAVPAPAIDELLRQTQGGSRRRVLPLLTALLGGLATAAHPSRATWLRQLRDDPVRRSAAVFLLAQAALDRCDQAPTRTDAGAWLEAEEPQVRALAVQAWQPAWRPRPPELDAFARIARADGEAEVRAAALRLLGRSLDRRALDLAERALRSRSADEAAAAAAVLLALAGDARRELVEDRIADGRLAPEVRVALLGVLPPPLPPRLLLLAHDLAHDGGAPPPVRAAGALALARAGSVLAGPALEAVFFASCPPPDLGAVAVALRELGRLPAVQAKTLGAAATSDAAALVARVRALAVAAPALGIELFLTLAESGKVRGDALGSALAGLRMARVQRATPVVLRLVPEAVAALVP